MERASPPSLFDVMEPLQNTKNEIDSRAKEIDTGAFPLSMENVLLGLPQKPTIAIEKLSVVSRPWSYSDLVSQKKLLTTLKVSKGETFNKSLWDFRNSWSNVRKTHFRNLDDIFLLKSWTINFLFEFRSSFQQVGLFNVVYSNIPRPLINYLVGEAAFASFELQVQLPHRKVYMGEDMDLHVALKWVSPFSSCMSTAQYYPGQSSSQTGTRLDDYDMGSLYLYCPCGMETSQGVNPDMTVRVWSYLTDVDYSGYNIDDDRL